VRVTIDPPSRVDTAIAAVVTLVTVLPLLVPTPHAWWIVAFGLASSVPVAWRRRAVLAVSALVGVATMTLVLFLSHQPVFLFLPYGGLVCAYTYAEWCPPRWRPVGIVLGVLGIAITLIVPHEDLETLRYVSTAYIAAYALGIGARARRAQRAAEEERTRRLAEERAVAVQRERLRIARDMHDIVTHSVGLIVVQADAGPLVVRDDPDKAEAIFEVIAETGRDAVGQLRRVLGTLRGGEREPQPGIDAVPELVAGAGRTDLDATVTEHGRRRAISAEVGVAAYRIVQESLTNTVRHASADTVRVTLTWTEAELTVEIADNGNGLARPGERSGSPGGHGIAGMRERVDACGGRLDIDPGRGDPVGAPPGRRLGEKAGEGFTVTATFPIG